MYTDIATFAEEWRAESKTTATMLDALTDASLGRPVSDKDRTLGRTAWHIVTTLPEMTGRTGLEIHGVREEDPIPASAAEIALAYRAASAELLKGVEAGWTDETLRVEDDMYGPTRESRARMGMEPPAL